MFLSISLNNSIKSSDEAINIFTKTIEKLKKINENLYDIKTSAREKEEYYEIIAENTIIQIQQNKDIINKINAIIK